MKFFKTGFSSMVIALLPFNLLSLDYNNAKDTTTKHGTYSDTTLNRSNGEVTIRLQHYSHGRLKKSTRMVYADQSTGNIVREEKIKYHYHYLLANKARPSYDIPDYFWFGTRKVKDYNKCEALVRKSFFLITEKHNWTSYGRHRKIYYRQFDPGCE